VTGPERLTPGSPGYPTGLLELASPPALWLRGQPPEGALAAVVGTRRPDRVGRALAADLAGALARRGYGVVSGLAPGIDTTAHRAALAAGGRTWAFIGAGVDRATSPEDPALVDRLVLSGGVLSEVDPGTAVTAGALIARDRLQSGSSVATVVVQTDLASGTMHTARFALAQGRPLVVMTPPPGHRIARWGGNLALSHPNGTDPALLHARGPLASRLARRTPVADLVLPAEGPWDALWELLEARRGAAGAPGGWDD
jgi:DNA protecting protein DprA